MIYQNYQEQQRVKEPTAPNAIFATVGAVYADGIALIFDGAEGETIKHYRCNKAVTFAAGERVYLIKDSGTYIVAFPVGLPTV